jgi:hypothetical protein
MASPHAAATECCGLSTAAIFRQPSIRRIIAPAYNPLHC